VWFRGSNFTPALFNNGQGERKKEEEEEEGKSITNQEEAAVRSRQVTIGENLFWMTCCRMNPRLS